MQPGPPTHMQKGERMIVLHITKLPLSLIFTKEKKQFFFHKKNTDTEHQKITLFQ